MAKVRRLKHRHPVFLLGMALQLLAAASFLLGFSAPAWSGKMGLWMKCDDNNRNCISNTGSGPNWMDATRSMEILALICIILSMAFEIYQDVIATPPPEENRAGEVLGMMGGIIGLIGISVYGGELHGKDIPNFAKDLGYIAPSPSSHISETFDPHLNWGFGLTTAGLILFFLASALIACSRAVHAKRTNQALAKLGVCNNHCTTHNTVPMQHISTSCVYQNTAHPHHSASVVMAPAHGSHGSQVPSCYVMVHGQMVPVYKDMPATIITTSTAGGTKHVEGSGDGLPSQRL